MATLDVVPSKDYRTASIVVKGHQGKIGEKKLNAREVERLIRSLALYRQNILGPPAVKPKPEDFLTGATDPDFHVLKRAAGEPVVLGICHSAIAWMRFVFRPRKANELTKALTGHTR